MKTIPYYHDLPDHKAPRVGKVCPRCGGSVVTMYRDEAPACMACGFVPVVTRSAAERIAYQQELMNNGGRRGHRPITGGIRL